jgi:hypothetical protein
MQKTLTVFVNHHQQSEKDNAALAIKYGQEGFYEDAAKWFRAAAFHRAVWEALIKISKEC